MSISEATPLILGSRSPRRRDILESLRLPFVVRAGEGNEAALAGETPHEYLDRIVRNKLSAAAAVVADDPGAALLVADTIVVIDGRMLGKPSDTAMARELLGQLVGRTHVVFTRYAVAQPPDLAQPIVERTVASRVTMRPCSDDEVQRYAASGEGLDKAGAYAVQGLGAFLIERIEGSHTNVVGLPACEVIMDLRKSGLLGSFP